MDLSSFFNPLTSEIIPKKYTFDSLMIRDFTQFNTDEFPDWRKADIVIIGCDDDRGAKELKGTAYAPDQIRQQFYGLAVPKREIALCDLGNLVKKERLHEYHDALALVTHEIVKAGKTLIVLGGTQDITYGVYMGYQKLTSQLEYVIIDSELDVADSDFGVNNHSYNHRIFLHAPNYLFNYTNLGYQSYFVPLNDRKRIQNLYFNAVRVGELKNNLIEAEPYLRNASMVSLDLSAVRSADAPGTTHPSPAGFSAEEVCQLARFSGMSNRVSSFIVSEGNPMKDINGQTMLLGALTLWYFIEGLYNRRIDEPRDLASLKKHRVALKGGTHELVFYKNPLTDRWWMEVPYGDSIGVENPRVELIPCSESEYLMAKEDEIPERWWNTHHKLK
jgi:formiminoglutamase